MTVEEVALEEVSHSDTQNPKTVCSNTDSRRQALSA